MIDLAVKSTLSDIRRHRKIVATRISLSLT